MFAGERDVKLLGSAPSCNQKDVYKDMPGKPGGDLRFQPEYTCGSKSPKDLVCVLNNNTTAKGNVHPKPS